MFKNSWWEGFVVTVGSVVGIDQTRDNCYRSIRKECLMMGVIVE